MASFNRVILVGNVTRDPEVRYTPGGTAVTELGLAVNRYWFDKQTNTRKEETTFVDVVLWARQAEVAGEYLSKGRPVLIEGRLQQDTWEDKETGKKRSRLRVVGETMQLLGGKGEGAGPREGGGRGRGGQQAAAPDPGASGGYDAESFYDSPAPGGSGDDEVPF